MRDRFSPRVETAAKASSPVEEGKAFTTRTTSKTPDAPKLNAIRKLPDGDVTGRGGVGLFIVPRARPSEGRVIRCHSS